MPRCLFCDTREATVQFAPCAHIEWCWPCYRLQPANPLIPGFHPKCMVIGCNKPIEQYRTSIHTEVWFDIHYSESTQRQIKLMWLNWLSVAVLAVIVANFAWAQDRTGTLAAAGILLLWATIHLVWRTVHFLATWVALASPEVVRVYDPLTKRVTIANLVKEDSSVATAENSEKAALSIITEEPSTATAESSEPVTSPLPVDEGGELP